MAQMFKRNRPPGIQNEGALYDILQFADITRPVVIKIPSFYLALGNGYLVVNKFRKALTAFQTALELYQSKKDRQGEGSSLGNLGLAYLSLVRYDKARDCYEQALSIFEDIKSPYAADARKYLAELEGNRGNGGHAWPCSICSYCCEPGKLFSNNLSPFSLNVGLRGVLFAINVRPKTALCASRAVYVAGRLQAYSDPGNDRLTKPLYHSTCEPIR